MTETATSPDRKHLQCMEVWGGNQAISMAVALPGLDAWIFSKPYGGDEGGGDVHYASSCATGALSRMLVADVSGHGSAVSEIASRLRKLMQRHVNQHQQTNFVRSLNREFSTMAQAGRFATAVAMSYDAPYNKLEICNAGHPPPLIYRREQRTWSYLEAPRNKTNFPLGIDDVAEYEEFEAPVSIGDVLICYTDALVECPLRDGGRMDKAALLKLCSEIAVRSPQEIVPELLRAIEAIGEIDDDVTVLTFSPNGTRPYVPLGDKLLAPYKFLRAVARGYSG